MHPGISIGLASMLTGEKVEKTQQNRGNLLGAAGLIAQKNPKVFSFTCCTYGQEGHDTENNGKMIK